jgi:hypothetical protein
MVYNLKRLSLTYIKGFKEFIKLNNLESLSVETRYNILSYSICKLYGLDPKPYAKGTSHFGRSCIAYLSKLKRTPKHFKAIPTTEKIALLGFVQAYFVTGNIRIRVVEVEDNGYQKSL